MKKNLIFSFSTLVFILFIILILSLLSSNKVQNLSSEFESIGFSENDLNISSKIKQMIINLGSERAYKIVREEIDDKSINLQNRVAITFGRSVFEYEGVDAISICKQYYRYRCLHGFFYKMIDNKGLSAVKIAENECNNYVNEHGQELNCELGIGRAILGYLGDNNLEKALLECQKLPWKAYLLGCQDGVFIEYFSSSDAEINEPKFKEIAGSNPHLPCTEISEKFKRECYYILPFWWLNIFGNDFKKAGSLCQSVENADMKKTCFFGTGKLAPSIANFNKEDIVKYCNEMPTSEGKNICFHGVLFAAPVTPIEIKSADLCMEFFNSGQKCNKKEEIINAFLYDKDLNNLKF